MTGKVEKKLQKKEFTGLFLVPELLGKNNISAIEKFILADVAYFPAGYRFSNSQMAAKFGIHKRTIINSLNRLRGFRYIIDAGPDKAHRVLKLGGEGIALLGKAGGEGFTLPKTPKKDKRSPSGTLGEIEFPKALDTPEFKKMWDAWVKYRIEAKKKLTPSTIEGQLNKLAKYPEDVAISTIRKSIDNGWQGLFPEKEENERAGFQKNQRAAKQFPGTDRSSSFAGQRSAIGKTI